MYNSLYRSIILSITKLSGDNFHENNIQMNKILFLIVTYIWSNV